MCGRYTLFADNDAEEIRALIRQAGDAVKTGEIYPTNTAPVLLDEGRGLQAQAVDWGFPRFGSGGVIINARVETAAEKRTFKACLAARRCVIPSTGFYEWDAAKQKILFRRQEDPLLYMAGLYNDFSGRRRFVILTTAANASVADVHNRMPLVLQRDQLAPWTQDPVAALHILQQSPPELARWIV